MQPTSPASSPASVRSRGGSEDSDSIFVMFGYLADGTMAVEIDLERCLLQWPYLLDMSWISALASIFNAGWREPAAAPEDAFAPECPPPERWTWLYVNFLMRDSQVRPARRSKAWLRVSRSCRSFAYVWAVAASRASPSRGLESCRSTCIRCLGSRRLHAMN